MVDILNALKTLIKNINRGKANFRYNNMTILFTQAFTIKGTALFKICHGQHSAFLNCEGCFSIRNLCPRLVRPHTWSSVKGRLSLKDTLKASYVLYTSFSLLWRMHQVYPLCPPITCTNSTSQKRIIGDGAHSVSLCNARQKNIFWRWRL